MIAFILIGIGSAMIVAGNLIAHKRLKELNAADFKQSSQSRARRVDKKNKKGAK